MRIQKVFFLKVFRWGFLTFICTVSLLFALCPFRPTGNIKGSLGSVLWNFSHFHKGVGIWSYYTTRNGLVNIQLFQLDPKSQEILKTQIPPAKIEFHPFIYQGHTELRFSMIGLSIIGQQSEHYPWLCRHYKLNRGVRYYVTLGRYFSYDHENYLFKLPEHFKGMERKFFQLSSGNLTVLSFVCT